MTETIGDRPPEALVRALVEQVFNAHDVTAADGLLAHDYIQHNPRVPTGRDGFKGYFADVFRGLPDYRYTIDQLVSDGETVVVRASVGGTHRGDLLGIPATGRPISFAAADFFRVENGMIKEHWDVVDQLAASLAIGLVHQPEGTAR